MKPYTALSPEDSQTTIDANRDKSSSLRVIVLTLFFLLSFLLTLHAGYILYHFNIYLSTTTQTPSSSLPVVWASGWITCVFTGLGSLPFFLFSTPPPSLLASSNAIAAGMMLSASLSLLNEACDFSLPSSSKTVLGIWLGYGFIKLSEHIIGDLDKADLLASLVLEDPSTKHRTHLKRMLLIFSVMLVHSFAEGVAIGVSHHRVALGQYVSFTLAIHNIPEGLALSLVFVSRRANLFAVAALCVLSSLPQPLMALPSYVFVGQIEGMLPVALGFAAGAMGYVAVFELLEEAKLVLGGLKAGIISVISGLVLVGLQYLMLNL